MRFEVLGTLRASVDGETVDLGWPKQRALLAALLLTPNRVVSRAELIAGLWGPNPPASATNGLQKYVSALRRVLGPSRVLTRAPGYLIAVEPAELDLLQFEALAAAERSREALELWRGEPCEDVELLGLWQAHLDALRERGDELRGRVIDQRLAAGEHESLIPELKALVHANPLREQHWARLMRAQHRAGRTAQALATYADLRALLADELGIDPGDELQSLHQSLLTGEEPRPLAVPQGGSGSAWVEQCQLPLDTSAFVGREDAEKEVCNALGADGVPIVILCGPPGVGKTALAVRIAHRLRNIFPDGQWFARLDGASTLAQDPADVIAALLQASGIEGSAIPDGIAARAAAFRARLADRRVLLILDDAAGADQVRPLLPGTTGSAVLVTSRNTLSGLVALENAQRATLGELSESDAVGLLMRASQPGGGTSDGHAFRELAALCGYLPLALRIAAANLASRAVGTVDSYVAKLRTGSRLAKLVVRGDDRIAVRAAFDLSYRTLPPEAQYRFRLLSLIPGVDFTVEAAAALFGSTTESADSTVDILVAASLLMEKSPGRFLFHDLIRLYAEELCAGNEGEVERHARVSRWYDWLVAVADTASDQLNHEMERLPRPIRVEGRFSDADSATAWLDAERANMVAAARAAADSTLLRSMAWHLSDAIRPYLWLGLYAADWAILAQHGLRAAQLESDARAEAAMQTSLGVLRWSLGDNVGAIERLRLSLDLLRDVPGAHIWNVYNNLGLCCIHAGQLREAAVYLTRAVREMPTDSSFLGRAIISSNLAAVYLELGQFDKAADLFKKTLALGERAGMLTGVTLCLGNLGWVELFLDNIDKARRYFERSLSLASEVGLRNGSVSPMIGLVETYARQGHYDDSVHIAWRAIRYARDSASELNEASALDALGRTYSAQGRWSDAADMFKRAWEMSAASGFSRVLIQARIGLADCDRHAGHVQGAIDHGVAASVAARAAGQRALEGDALFGLATSYRLAGQRQQAVSTAVAARRCYMVTGQRARAKLVSGYLDRALHSHPQAPNG